MTKKEEIDKKGWILIKNVFSENEINRFREFVEKEKNHKGDLLSSNLLKDIILDDRILNIFKESLGTDKLFYFGDSSFSIAAKGSGFHKDSKDREKIDSPEFKDKNYSLLRLGIYLQDHSEHSRGLCLRSESHLYPTIDKGKIINVKSEIGDVVIWKLTTTHSANANAISLFPNYPIHPKMIRFIPNFMRQKSIEQRMAIFMCFGIEDNYASSYLNYLKTRQYAVTRWMNSNYSQQTIDNMTHKKVKVYDSFDINEIDNNSVNVNYKQI